jgi:DNA sulfur modification protein DndB
MQNKSAISIIGQVGVCGHLEVFLGFAPAGLLHAASFADVLNEDTGEGYQRPRNTAHSRSFRQYIVQPNTSTIPLTFNLRKGVSHDWRIIRHRSGTATLHIKKGVKCLAQVDCQHRLGELGDQDISLAFMAFIGLDLRSEMALFNVINSRAKGLSSSLTDYHETKLLDDLAVVAPHLLIAKRLNEEPDSPWCQMVRYGGESSSGLRRRTSLRMLQTCIRRFLRQCNGTLLGDVETKYGLIVAFWRAVKAAFPEEWDDHRHHLLAKGVGLYSMMTLLGDLVREAGTLDLSEEWFRRRLAPLIDTIDWSSKGMFANAGGRKGAAEVHLMLRKAIGL